VAARRSDLARADRDIRNAEARIRALVDAPMLRMHRAAEMVPLDAPLQHQLSVDLQDASATALNLRPEINQALRQVRSAAWRLRVAENELLPYLDLVLQTYVMGIAGRGDIAQAFADQFGKGEPAYSVGLQFELPLGRREARAVQGRRRIELRQLTSHLESTVVDVLTDVEIAVGEVETTYLELRGKFEAMKAAEEEVAYLNERWQLLPGEQQAASFVLDELLDAQQRAAFEQYGFAQAQVNHTLALVHLRRATGTLLQHEGVIFQRFCEGGVPRLSVHKPLNPSDRH
jgi:outer membrane protein TolC